MLHGRQRPPSALTRATVNQGFEVIGPGGLGPFATRARVRPLTVVSAIGPTIVVLVVAGVGFLLHQAVP